MNTNIAPHQQSMQGAAPVSLAPRQRKDREVSPSLWDLNKDVLREISTSLDCMSAKSLYLTSHQAEDLHQELIDAKVPKAKLSAKQLKAFEGAVKCTWDRWLEEHVCTLDEKKAIQALGSDTYQDLSDAMKIWCNWDPKVRGEALFKVLVHLVRHGATFDDIKMSSVTPYFIYYSLAKHDDPELVSLFLKRNLPIGARDDLIKEARKIPNSRVLKMLTEDQH